MGQSGGSVENMGECDGQGEQVAVCHLFVFLEVVEIERGRGTLCALL